MASKIRKGDTVEVIKGKNRGTRGAVLRVDHAGLRVVVERVNIAKCHQKPSAQNRQGGIVEVEKPIAISNIALVHRGEPTRVGFKIIDGQKVRWSRRHDEAIDG